jgi:hypothetical protein
MRRQQEPERAATRPSPSSARRRGAYAAPAITFRSNLEVHAALCTPSPPAKSDFAACPSGPFSS